MADQKVPASSRETSASDAGSQKGESTRTGFSLSNIRVGTRIGLVVALPVIVAVAFGGMSVMDNLTKKNGAEYVGDVTTVAASIGAAVHELQKERGMNALFIGADGKKFAAEVAQQRKDSDVALAALTAKLDTIGRLLPGEGAAKHLEALRAGLSSLPEFRNGIDKMSVTKGVSGKKYTGLINNGLTLVEHTGNQVNDPAILRNVTSYIAVLWAKEFAGQERALGAGVIGAKSFSAAEMQRYFSLGATQDAEFHIFDVFADQALRDLKKKLVNDPAYVAFVELRRKMFAASDSGLFEGSSRKRGLIPLPGGSTC